MRYGVVVLAGLLTACTSMDSIKARLEADPNCKPQIHKVTGAVMPCLGPEAVVPVKAGKPPAVDVPAGATPARVNAPPATTAVAPAASAAPTASPAAPAAAGVPASAPAPKAPAEVSCKGQMHKKLGVVIPCPNG